MLGGEGIEMDKIKVINIIATPGPVLFFLICFYGIYQCAIGHGNEPIPTLVEYLFIYALFSFVLWLVTFFRGLKND